MSRPRKSTVDYFPHDCIHRKTLFILEQRYANDGYSFWFKLLEYLGDTEGHSLDFNDANNWEYLQAKTHLSEITCTEILNLLSGLGAIDKELWSHKIVWCQKFVDRLAPIYTNRRVEIPARPDNYSKKPHGSEVSTGRLQAETPQESIGSIGSKDRKGNRGEPKGSPDKSPKTWTDLSEGERKADTPYKAWMLWQYCYQKAMEIAAKEKQKALGMFKAHLKAKWNLTSWIPKYFNTKDEFVQKFCLESFDSWVVRQKTKAAK